MYNLKFISENNYYANNKKKCLEHQKKYYKNNKNNRLEYQKNYYSYYNDEISSYQQEYYYNNKSKILKQQKRQRDIKKKNIPIPKEPINLKIERDNLIVEI